MDVVLSITIKLGRTLLSLVANGKLQTNSNHRFKTMKNHPKISQKSPQVVKHVVKGEK